MKSREIRRLAFASSLLAAMAISPGPLAAQAAGDKAATQGSVDPGKGDAGKGAQDQGKVPSVNDLGKNRGEAGREQMWAAPTAEDWKLPVKIKWQRTWADALAIQKQTGKAILICVNMDGEIASEHYAGIRYRQPAIAKLYEPYICVIASVYRHNPRDFDEQGRRVPCPRFGTVTCGEHIAIEPLLYEKYFDKTRVAPRHIMIELDGKESYDLYYAFDTKSVFKQITDGISQRQGPPITEIRGDRTILERVASRDSGDRSAVEKAFLEGDKELRAQILAAVAKHAGAEQNDVLRLAVFGFDKEIGKRAREILADTKSTGAVDVINEALRVPMKAEERKSLLASLIRLGKKSQKARKLAVVHTGLAQGSSKVDAKMWASKLSGATYPAPTDRAAMLSKLDKTDAARKERPKDVGAYIEAAEASLELAIDPKSSRRRAGSRGAVRNYARLMFEDARIAATEAKKLGAKGWRVESILALCAKEDGKRAEAYAHARAAMDDMPTGLTSRRAMLVLEIYAYGKQREITRAVVAKKDWPSQWLADVHSAYAVLAKHPMGGAVHVANHYDFLAWLGVGGQASRVLDAGLQRFPEAFVLHDRLRGRVLRTRGPSGLERTYEKLLEKNAKSANLHWYAGYASIVAAEFHRRRGRSGPATAAYGRAIKRYEKAVELQPATKDSSDHYVALALAGWARISFENGDDERAVTDLIASFERKPLAAATQDGLNISPADTARSLMARFRSVEKPALQRRLREAMNALPPEMLELPEYERASRGGRPPNQGGRRGNRGNRRGNAGNRRGNTGNRRRNAGDRRGQAGQGNGRRNAAGTGSGGGGSNRSGTGSGGSGGNRRGANRRGDR